MFLTVTSWTHRRATVSQRERGLRLAGGTGCPIRGLRGPGAQRAGIRGPPGLDRDAPPCQPLCQPTAAGDRAAARTPPSR